LEQQEILEMCVCVCINKQLFIDNATKNVCLRSLDPCYVGSYLLYRIGQDFMDIQLQLIKVGGKGRRGLFGSFLSFSLLSSKKNWTIISLLQLFIQAATFTFFFFFLQTWKDFIKSFLKINF